MVTGLALAGFDAVTVERVGYVDGAAGLRAELAPLLGRPRTPSAGLEWYDLRPLRKKLAAHVTPAALARARRLLLYSAVARIENSEPAIAPPQPERAQWFEQRSAIVVHNPLPGTRRVQLTREGSALVVTVQDDGRGTGPFSEGMGLGGMRDRTTQLGGTLDALRTPHGFLVRAVLPEEGSTR